MKKHENYDKVFGIILQHSHKMVPLSYHPLQTQQLQISHKNQLYVDMNIGLKEISHSEKRNELVTNSFEDDNS